MTRADADAGKRGGGAGAMNEKSSSMAEMAKTFNKDIIAEFRANDGKVGGQFAGANLLLLTTTGAKSGRPRLSPLAYFRIDGKLIVIGSFAGAPINPAWVHNLRANPQAHVEVGSESGIDAFDVTARELTPAPAAAYAPSALFSACTNWA
jgi:deazaflavin-dependent oxidoreductase (nitroreductase family)